MDSRPVLHNHMQSLRKSSPCVISVQRNRNLVAATFLARWKAFNHTKHDNQHHFKSRYPNWCFGEFEKCHFHSRTEMSFPFVHGNGIRNSFGRLHLNRQDCRLYPYTNKWLYARIKTLWPWFNSANHGFWSKLRTEMTMQLTYACTLRLTFCQILQMSCSIRNTTMVLKWIYFSG